MASFFNHRIRHLDATFGREVVYCHTCSHEWYRDENPSLSLVCPSCSGEITEIVESTNDPRFDNGIGNFPNIFGNNQRGSDSDPEEEDITNPNFARAFRPAPSRPNRRQFNDGDQPGIPPGSDVLSRFLEMMMDDLGGGRVVRDAQGPPGLFGQNLTGEPRAGTRIHHTTYTSGPNTTTSVTFTTGSVPLDGPAGNFGTLFGSLMGGPTGGPAGNQSARAEDAGPGGPPPFRFGHLLASILSPGAFNGDAVHSQEELDRIITQLMEHTPSNAAPPASQSAIDKLEKKVVDIEMLGSDGKAECTICIDELNVGDEVTVLPCTHWYHGECVTLWLKEHNTCPICRKPVESQDAGENNGGQRSPRSPETQRSDAGPSSPAAPPRHSPSLRVTREAPNIGAFLESLRQTPEQQRAEEEGRHPQLHEGLARLDARAEGILANRRYLERIRQTARLPAERRPDRSSGRRRLERIRQTAGLPSETSEGSSGQRRSSISPPGAWPDSPSQSRLRSPSLSHTEEFDGSYFASAQNSRSSDRRSYAAPNREQREAQQSSNSGAGDSDGNNGSGSGSGNNGSSGGGGHNLFSWMRDHFSRGSGNNADRDRR